MTYFIDCYSRMVMGWMVAVRQSSDAVLEALRDAILHDPDSEQVYGGTPGVVMYDNGLTFLAEVVQDAASYLDFRTRPVAPYSPHQNGKVERCHQTISQLALSEIADWDHGPRNKAGRLYDDTAISERELIARVGAAVQVYNFERPHSALGGRTPWQAFADDPASLRLYSPERLRFALRHRKIQKVSAHGVYKHGRWYRHVEIDARVGGKSWHRNPSAAQRDRAPSAAQSRPRRSHPRREHPPRRNRALRSLPRRPEDPGKRATPR
jgi:hypothetical protein